MDICTLDIGTFHVVPAGRSVLGLGWQARGSAWRGPARKADDKIFEQDRVGCPLVLCSGFSTTSQIMRRGRSVGNAVALAAFDLDDLLSVRWRMGQGKIAREWEARGKSVPGQWPGAFAALASLRREVQKRVGVRVPVFTGPGIRTQQRAGRNRWCRGMK